jgi:hypothetical protein
MQSAERNTLVGRDYSESPNAGNATLRILPAKLRFYLGREQSNWQSSTATGKLASQQSFVAS